MNITFDIPLPHNPTGTAQQKGEKVINGKIVHFTKKKVSEMRTLYIVGIRNGLAKEGVHGNLALKGPVRVSAVFHYEIKDEHRWGERMTAKNKGDLDNITKGLLDAMTDAGVFDRGDEQVAELMLGKVYSNRPHVKVKIETLEAFIV